MRLSLLSLLAVLCFSTTVAFAQESSSKSKSADKLYERGLSIESSESRAMKPLAVIPIVPPVALSQMKFERTWMIGEVILFDKLNVSTENNEIRITEVGQMDSFARLVMAHPELEFAVFTIPTGEEVDASAAVLPLFAKRALIRKETNMENVKIGEASADWANIFFKSSKDQVTNYTGKLVAMVININEE